MKIRTLPDLSERELSFFKVSTDRVLDFYLLIYCYQRENSLLEMISMQAWPLQRFFKSIRGMKKAQF